MIACPLLHLQCIFGTKTTARLTVEYGKVLTDTYFYSSIEKVRITENLHRAARLSYTVFR